MNPLAASDEGFARVCLSPKIAQRLPHHDPSHCGGCCPGVYEVDVEKSVPNPRAVSLTAAPYGYHLDFCFCLSSLAPQRSPLLRQFSVTIYQRRCSGASIRDSCSHSSQRRQMATSSGCGVKTNFVVLFILVYLSIAFCWAGGSSR